MEPDVAQETPHDGQNGTTHPVISHESTSCPECMMQRAVAQLLCYVVGEMANDLSTATREMTGALTKASTDMITTLRRITLTLTKAIKARTPDPS